MSGAQKLADLKALSNEDLIAKYDEEAKHTVVGTQHYLDELRYREQSRIASNVERFTRHILCLTVVVVIATLVNVGVVVFTVFNGVFP